MTTKRSKAKAVKDHRDRLRTAGFERLELTASSSDRVLLREAARMLSSGGKEADELRCRLGDFIKPREPEMGGIFAALRDSPLVEAALDSKRVDDYGREIDL